MNDASPPNRAPPPPPAAVAFGADDAYIRPFRPPADAGPAEAATLYALHAADGRPLGVAESYAAARAFARAHNLRVGALH